MCLAPDGATLRCPVRFAVSLLVGLAQRPIIICQTPLQKLVQSVRSSESDYANNR